jgi:hypothetical protein
MQIFKKKQTYSQAILITVGLLLLTYASVGTSQTIKSYITGQWQDSRYIDHNNGTVTDKVTKLMWAKCSLGQNSTSTTCSGSATNHNWKDALEQANSSTLAGYSDWRLPNVKELYSLLALDRFHPAINLSIFPNTPNSSTDEFWTSSPKFFRGEAIYNSSWIVDFYNGYDTLSSRPAGNRVRLVRSTL